MSHRASSLHHVYDKLYKSLFAHSELLQEFFDLYFPDIGKQIDFRRGKIQKSSFIKSEYIDREADIIYSVPISGKEVYIYILIEHQSRPDRRIFLRLLEYQLALWNDLVEKKKTNPLKLPPIVPIVIYNGKANWNIPVEFKKSFIKVPRKIMNLVPVFRYLLFDLNKTSQTSLIEGDEIIKLPLLLDKKRDHIDSIIHHFLRKFPYTQQSYSEIWKNILQVSYYFILYHTKKTPEQLELDIEGAMINAEIKEELVKMSKSAAMRLIEKGREEGREKGREKGREEGREKGREEGLEKGREEGREEGLEKGRERVALLMLKEGTELELVAKFTELSLKRIKQLKSTLT